MAKDDKKKDKQLYTLHIDHTDKPEQKPKVQKFHRVKPKDEEQEGESVSDKIWNSAKFISTAAIIFIVALFVMNWNAYQAIIMNKLGFNEPSTEYEDQIDTVNQELMELSKDPEAQKKQIPSLDVEVAPPDTRIIIPRINKNVPVVTVSTDALVNKDWERLEAEIQEALQGGVVHYPGTAFPGEPGNIVVTGHSSYFFWDPGRFKDVFALLHDVRIGDSIYMYYNQKKFEYEVYDTKVVLPTEVEVLTQEGGDKLTLITCTPVGTNLKRLIVFAKPV